MFGERLRKERNKRELSLEEVAKLLNISKNALSGYERGLHEPKFETLIDFSYMYGVSIDYLVGVTDDPDPKHDQRDLKFIFRKKPLHYGGTYLTHKDLEPVRKMTEIIAKEAEHRQGKFQTVGQTEHLAII